MPVPTASHDGLQVVDSNRSVARECVEVRISVEYPDIGADGDRCDQAVDELADCCAALPAGPIQHGGILIIARSGWEDGRAREQTSEVVQVPLVACAREDLHANGIAGSEAGAE